MNQKELDLIVAEHALWLADLLTGYQADFRWDDLRGLDLCGANLFGIDFRWADCRDANFRGANLRDSNFFGADIRGTVYIGITDHVLNHAHIFRVE